MRDNIQAHNRFACARDGELLFDDDEYIYIRANDRSRVPDQLRPLFDLAWFDLDLDFDFDEDDGPDPKAVALAEVITGVVLTADDFARAEAVDVTWHRVRSLQYVRED